MQRHCAAGGVVDLEPLGVGARGAHHQLGDRDGACCGVLVEREVAVVVDQVLDAGRVARLAWVHVGVGVEAVVTEQTGRSPGLRGAALHIVVEVTVLLVRWGGGGQVATTAAVRAEAVAGLRSPRVHLSRLGRRDGGVRRGVQHVGQTETHRVVEAVITARDAHCARGGHVRGALDVAVAVLVLLEDVLGGARGIAAAAVRVPAVADIRRGTGVHVGRVGVGDEVDLKAVAAAGQDRGARALVAGAHDVAIGVRVRLVRRRSQVVAAAAVRVEAVAELRGSRVDVIRVSIRDDGLVPAVATGGHAGRQGHDPAGVALDVAVAVVIELVRRIRRARRAASGAVAVVAIANLGRAGEDG